MPPVSLARNAMATRFELVLHGDNESALRAAGEEALDEIDRLESQLSLYRAGSEIAQVNARAAREPVRVTAEVFALLQHAKKLSEETGGAFDITIAPLVRCWGFMGGNQPGQLPTPNPSQEGSKPVRARQQFPSLEGSGAGSSSKTGRVPSADELETARAVVGMNLVHLDEQNRTVCFARDGVMLDLGAIGKGYAVERAANLLRDAGIASALIHGGTSTVHAIGRQPDGGKWKIAIETPSDDVRSSTFRRLVTTPPPEGGTPNLLATIPLEDESLSMSAVWGRAFESGGKKFGHVIDPRTGQPVSGALLAAVVLPSATETDALSTALLTSGSDVFEKISSLRSGMKTLLVTDSKNGPDVQHHGIDISRDAKLPVEKESVRG